MKLRGNGRISTAQSMLTAQTAQWKATNNSVLQGLFYLSAQSQCDALGLGENQCEVDRICDHIGDTAHCAVTYYAVRRISKFAITP